MRILTFTIILSFVPHSTANISHIRENNLGLPNNFQARARFVIPELAVSYGDLHVNGNWEDGNWHFQTNAKSIKETILYDVPLHRFKK
mgnify:CR=1 FL=1